MATKPNLKHGETLHEYLNGIKIFYQKRLLAVADQLAHKYESRGQIDQAIEHWSMHRGQKNHLIDSLKVQAMLKSPHIGHEEMLCGQKEWAADHEIYLPDNEFVRFQPFDNNRKIRVAYACCWFNSSTIRGQVMPFISAHDHSKFSIVGYSLGPCDLSITKYFDEFYDVTSISDLDFAKKVRADNIDVLIELTGFSPHHRFGAMGARCAPIQISYLNHLGTSGIKNVDYVLADLVAVPEGIDMHFTESIYYLPNTFFCFNYNWDLFPKIKEPPHLRNGYITFGCFGSQSKLNDAIIHLWARLLHNVPKSQLLLRNMGLNSYENREFMQRRFARWGIPSSRLLLKPGGTREEIKENYNDVDISLDTWPYCGGNTIAESQWMGVPVITLKGDRFAAAYGASLLRASGCEELIASTPAEYLTIAENLAADSPKIIDYRNTLRHMMVEFGFGDPIRFAKDMENAFDAMMRRAFPITS